MAARMKTHGIFMQIFYVSTILLPLANPAILSYLMDKSKKIYFWKIMKMFRFELFHLLERTYEYFITDNSSNDDVLLAMDRE